MAGMETTDWYARRTAAHVRLTHSLFMCRFNWKWRRRSPTLDDERCLVKGYVEHYNNVRLNSAVGYITPKYMLAGRQREITA
jgi:hypothetical protein